MELEIESRSVANELEHLVSLLRNITATKTTSRHYKRTELFTNNRPELDRHYAEGRCTLQEYTNLLRSMHDLQNIADPLLALRWKQSDERRESSNAAMLLDRAPQYTMDLRKI